MTDEIERLRAELDLERRRLNTSEELRTALVDLLHQKDAEIKHLLAAAEIEQLRAEIKSLEMDLEASEQDLK